MSQLYLKVRRNFLDYGPIRTAQKSLRQVLGKVHLSTPYLIYGLDVENCHPEFEDDRFYYRLIPPDDMDAIRQIESEAEWMAGQLRARICEGSLCMAALHEQQVVAFNLVSFQQVDIPIAELRWTFQPGEAWSEHISTHRAWRRRGIAEQIRYRVVAELQKKRVRWFFGGTLGDHRGTLRLARRCGFVELGILRHRRTFGWESWHFEEFQLDEHHRYFPQPFRGVSQLSADQLSL